jgi:sulfoxide reductase heme-binding subunit YedZ
MDYRPVFTGLGIIGGWLAVLLGLSFYLRRHIGAKRWRSLHRATIAVWALAVIHVIGGGTDATQVWMQAILLLTGVPIVFLFLRRILPADEPRRPVAARAVRGEAAR